MKKIICIALLLFAFTGCKKGMLFMPIEIGESTKFSKQEIEDAIKKVKSGFPYPGATLTKIWYDEEISNDLIVDYLETGMGVVNKVKAENVIILLSNFEVGSIGVSPTLNPNSTYTDYQWTLIRDSQTNEWKVNTWGY